MSAHPFPVTTALLLALALITGCGKKEETKVATQVAARVNSDEITVHQINNVLARNQNVAPEAADQSKREILDRLINQQLARQMAIAKELDRSPSVVQAIEAAKTEILARAYLEQIAAAIPKTAAWEVQKYYKEHPELFAQRRVFTLEELAFVADNDVATRLREQMAKARSMQEVADGLQSQGVKFVANRGIRAAEQILLEILPKVQAMKVGEKQLLELGSERYLVIRVAAYKDEPVDEATAAPRIQQFLWNRRTAEVIEKEMKKIKDQAKIEYVGEFAGRAGGTDKKMKVEDESTAQTRDESKGKSETKSQVGIGDTPKVQSPK